MNKLVAIYSSNPQSGKSSVGVELEKKGYVKYSFAKPVKDSLLILLNSLDVKKPTDYLYGSKKDNIIPISHISIHSDIVKEMLDLILVEMGLKHFNYYYYTKTDIPVLGNPLVLLNKLSDYLNNLTLSFTGGYLMSDYATTFWRDSIYTNVWLDIAKPKINKMLLKSNIYIDDMRFINEYKHLDFMDSTFIKIIRDSAGLNGRTMNSEGNLTNLNYNYTIENNGTLLEFEENIKKCIKLM